MTPLRVLRRGMKWMCMGSIFAILLYLASEKMAVPSAVLTLTQTVDKTAVKSPITKSNPGSASAVNGDENSGIPNGSPDSLVETLTRDFKFKMALPPARIVALTSHCDLPQTRGNSCNGTCQRLHIDPDVRTRVSQIVSPPHHHIPPDYNKVIQDMATKVKGHHDIIIATAASNNHFNESQTMITYLHRNIFPLVKNLKLIFYNLGLSPEQRAQMEKHCKCQVIDFPFKKFPSFFGKLGCYTWKPIIVKAHANQADVFVWADSSVRFDKNTFMKTISVTKQRGFQFRYLLSSDTVSRTHPSTFHFFGEEPCAYIGLGEIGAGYGFYANTQIVDKLVLEPWVACALTRQCMCPEPIPTTSQIQANNMVKAWKAGKSPYKYGLAHRFDQSALNVLLFKLYRERYRDVHQSVIAANVSRGDTSLRFPAPDDKP